MFAQSLDAAKGTDKRVIDRDGNNIDHDFDEKEGDEENVQIVIQAATKMVTYFGVGEHFPGNKTLLESIVYIH